MEYGIYPQSTPELRTIQKEDGTLEMQVRYRNDPMGYCSKWLSMNTIQEKEIESINNE